MKKDSNTGGAASSTTDHAATIAKLEKLKSEAEKAEDAYRASHIDLPKLLAALREEITYEVRGYDDPNETLEERLELYQETRRRSRSVEDAKERYEQSIAKSNAALERKNRAEKELADALKPILKARTTELLGAYESLLEQVGKLMRPYCRDEDETASFAKIFPVPTRTHERYIWLLSACRDSDCVVASVLIRELALPMPAGPEWIEL